MQDQKELRTRKALTQSRIMATRRIANGLSLLREARTNLSNAREYQKDLGEYTDETRIMAVNEAIDRLLSVEHHREGV